MDNKIRLTRIFDEFKHKVHPWKLKNVVFGLVALRQVAPVAFKDILRGGAQDAFREWTKNKIVPETIRDFVNIHYSFDNLETEQEKSYALFTILSKISEMEVDDHDLMGELYEELLDSFATSAGKDGGEFFTPPCLARLIRGMVQTHMDCPESIENITGKKELSVYDPTCGSGSLLAQFRGFKQYGQEINPESLGLAKLNALVHGADSVLRRGDSLKECKLEEFEEKKLCGFNYVVANPPYSLRWDGKAPQKYTFLGTPTRKSADFVFIQHCLKHLGIWGRAFILQYPSVMWRAGADAKIRDRLIVNDMLEAVIELPENLFYGTTIGVSLLVLRGDSFSKFGDQVLLIDAKKLFCKCPKQNQMLQSHLNKIWDAYAEYLETGECEKPGFATVVDNAFLRGQNVTCKRWMNYPGQLEEYDKEAADEAMLKMMEELENHFKDLSSSIEAVRRLIKKK